MYGYNFWYEMTSGLTLTVVAMIVLYYNLKKLDFKRTEEKRTLAREARRRARR